MMPKKCPRCKHTLETEIDISRIRDTPPVLVGCKIRCIRCGWSQSGTVIVDNFMPEINPVVIHRAIKSVEEIDHNPPWKSNSSQKEAPA